MFPVKSRLSTAQCGTISTVSIIGIQKPSNKAKISICLTKLFAVNYSEVDSPIAVGGTSTKNRQSGNSPSEAHQTTQSNDLIMTGYYVCMSNLNNRIFLVYGCS